jgi:hypothetical protein
MKATEAKLLQILIEVSRFIILICQHTYWQTTKGCR